LLDDARETAAGDRGHRAFGEALEIHAGREAPPRTGQHAHDQAVVAVEVLEGCSQGLGQLTIDGVARVGTVERDESDGLASLDEDGTVIGHDRKPSTELRCDEAEVTVEDFLTTAWRG
jgi:hypothetical protein